MNPKYRAPEEQMTSSERAAHFLKWHHEQKPGVRVQWRDMVKIMNNLATLPNRSNALVVAVSRNTHNIGRAMRANYKLDIDANRDGVRVLEKVEDQTKFALAKRVKKASLAVRNVEEHAKFVLERRAQFKDPGLRKFAERAAAGASTAKNQLPGLEETKGLLTSGDD